MVPYMTRADDEVTDTWVVYVRYTDGEFAYGPYTLAEARETAIKINDDVMFAGALHPNGVTAATPGRLARFAGHLSDEQCAEILTQRETETDETADEAIDG